MFTFVHYLLYTIIVMILSLVNDISDILTVLICHPIINTMTSVFDILTLRVIFARIYQN